MIDLLYIEYTFSNPNVKVLHQNISFLYTSDPHNYKSDSSSPFTMPGRGMEGLQGSQPIHLREPTKQISQHYGGVSLELSEETEHIVHNHVFRS